MRHLKPNEVVWAAQSACVLEASAEKPGNVTRYKDFPDLRYEDFLISAIAIGPALRDVKRVPVGKSILRAIRDTQRFVSYNTNLGIVLLLVPLVKAYGPGNLRKRLSKVLASLTVDDACKAYEAIRLARPGGMGRVEKYDITEEVDITLREAMWLAKDRDSIAMEYVTDYEITFELGYPSLVSYWEQSRNLMDSVVQASLTILAEVPDTLIGRKNGPAIAEEVSRKARMVLEWGGVFSERGKEALEEFDLYLREENHRLNPGTTADLTASSILVALLEGGLYEMFEGRGAAPEARAIPLASRYGR
ncbi:MAG: triphosphoribosyl-dephospho-CoA synthase [Chloroflexi bacterium]|nr:triphosphoribosyl-dephospho-CoA synthase [Chloroflexota bacterium]